MKQVLDFDMADELEQAHAKLDELGIERTEPEDVPIGGGMAYSLQVRVEKLHAAGLAEGERRGMEAERERVLNIATVLDVPFAEGIHGYYGRGYLDALKDYVAAIRASLPAPAPAPRPPARECRS